jgi:TonB family protein
VVPFQGKADFLFSQGGFKKAAVKDVMLVANTPTILRVLLMIDDLAETVLVGADIKAAGSAQAQSQRRIGWEKAAVESRNPRVAPAQAFRKYDPVYPQDAIQQKIESIVILEVTVDADGGVTDVRVIKGHPLFDDAAVQAVRQWSYYPAVLNGKARQSRSTVTVVFKLLK